MEEQKKPGDWAENYQVSAADLIPKVGDDPAPIMNLTYPVNVANAAKSSADASREAVWAQQTETYYAMKEQLDRLALFIRRNYQDEIESGAPWHQDDAVCAAVHYMEIERRRWSVRLRLLLSWMRRSR